MRVAISLTGFIRTWEYTKRSFVEQILWDPNTQIDVFVNTYYQNYYESTAGKQDVLMSKEDIEKLLDGIPVKSLVIENREEMFNDISNEARKYSHVENFGLLQLESSDKNSIEIPIGIRTFDHLRKLRDSNKQIKAYSKQNNIQYDLVVKTRFDLLYFNKLRWTEFTDNKLHCGYGATFGYPEDTFCVAQPEIMDRYLERLSEFPEMFDKDNQKVSVICSHATLKYIIEKYKFTIGLQAVNSLCFRSETSVQYNGNYRYHCDINWIYDTLTSFGIEDVFHIEAVKNNIMIF